MIAPLPPPPPDRPELPRVRLEVRTGSGRTISYEVGSEEFLIGGAAGCDLRLPTPNLPPVVAQLTRKADGVRVRRLAPGLPVLLNAHPLPSNTASNVVHADRLTVAGLEITLHIQVAGFISAKLIPLDPHEQVQPPALVPDNRREELDAEERARREEWSRQDAELIRRQREVDRQTEELEADRVLWYRRRQEMEHELAQAKATLAMVPPELVQKREELGAWENELNRVRDELTALREQFLKQYQDRRDEFVQMQAATAEGTASLASEREAFEEEQAARLREVDAEIARRRAAADAEAALIEPRLAEVREQRARLASASQELVRQRESYQTDCDALQKSRSEFETERAAQAEREIALAEREELLQRELDSFKQTRQEFQADLLRLDRHREALEERERNLIARSTEAESRFEQIQRDAAEWEQTVRLATSEQDRLRAETERLDRQKAELDTQTTKLAERAAQLEAQQAVIAILRSKLDRTRVDVEREASVLAMARIREDESQAVLRTRIQEAEQLRAELSIVHENAAEERRRLEEGDSLLAAGLEEIRLQKLALDAQEEKFREREAELDRRAAEFAEQAGSLKGRMTQALDWNARLEADRVAIREREAALAQAEEARQSLQEQLRRRAEDLSSRSKALDELGNRLATDRAALEAERLALTAARDASAEELSQQRLVLDARVAEVQREAEALHERETNLARQVARVREVGATVATERKALVEARTRWEADREAGEAETRQTQAALGAFRDRIAAEIDSLRSQAPELDEQARTALDRLNGARELLRGHLGELNEFARQSREHLDSVRAEVRVEADRLHEQQVTLDQARSEHRLAVTAFRQQLVEWQGRVNEMKRGLSQSETRLDARQAAVNEAARQAEATTQQLAEEAERLRTERQEVAAKRSEMENHLADMREWYRRKLRELAAGHSVSDSDMPTIKLHNPGTTHEPPQPATSSDASTATLVFDDLNPGDRQLGELLRSLELVDAESLDALWTEASRQRRTLRQVLLASGAITLYQLALIEAGNLDGLMLGRLRVIDRLRVTPREAIYRVFDPSRMEARVAGLPITPGLSGIFLLRHLAESEMQDAVHPDEFRQRFRAGRDAGHPNLANIVDVLEINGRPATLEEWLTGLFSADWPAHAAHPGCWVRLMTMAASGLEAAHNAGLVHGRISSDSFVLTVSGVLKLTGYAEPPWLAMTTLTSEPSAAADLRALGQVAFGWSQLTTRKKTSRTKPFPAELATVIRRLEADAESPMGDTLTTDQPYASATDLLTDLKHIARETSFSDDAWEKLLKHVVDHAPDAPAALRQSA